MSWGQRIAYAAAALTGHWGRSLLTLLATACAALRFAQALGAVAAGQTTPLLLGSGAASICGIAAIRAFVRTLRSRVFYRFAYYTWTAGLLPL